MTEVGARFGTLTVTVAGAAPVEYTLDLPAVVVGRAEGSAILIDHLSVSRRHARLSIESGRLMIEDLGSAAGTFIGGRQIPPHVANLVEGNQEIRFGEVSARYAAPPEIAAAEEAAAPLEATELPPTIRVTLTPPVEPIMPGGSPAIAYLDVQNRGRVVDELTITVQNIPADWIRVSQPRLVLIPGDHQEVSIIIQPPRRPESSAGIYDFSVLVTSEETNREVHTTGRVSILPFEEMTLTLRPVRSKKKFELVAENGGNAVVSYTISGKDDEDTLRYEFPEPSLVLHPGETKTMPFRVRGKRRLLGRQEILPFTVVATSATDTEAETVAFGQKLVKPPLQPFVFPTIMLLVVAAAVLGAIAYFFWPVWPFEESEEAKLEAFYAGVHMCDKSDEATPAPAPAASGSATEAPLFAQTNPQWAEVEYARAQDPEFGPDWCGDTIAQCGCAMTSVATLMSMLQLVTMPDGAELNPQTLNAWFNGDAVKTERGWVSRGYVYGDVLWTSVNQLSGEIARLNPGKPMIRFSRTGSGSDEEVRAELNAGRPIILEVPGHWIAAVQIDSETNQVLINDPYYRDRKTLDYYRDKGLVLSSVLFEASDDLSAVVITVPRDVRVRVTDKEGHVVGTLNEAPADDAAAEAQVGIEGASYSTRRAWRDPTCVESPPPLEAGTNQIVLPGSADDYTIEVLGTTEEAASVAIHSYDKNGVPTITTEDSPGGPISVDYDPDKPNATVTVVPTPTPTGGDAGDGGDGGDGGGDSGNGDSSETPTVATETPTAGTPTPAPTATPTPPAPPSNVAITCETKYQENPPLATVECKGTVDGAYTNANWTVNGVPAVAEGLAMTTTFTKNTTLTVQLEACNVTACQSSASAVKVEFPPPGATPTPTNTPTGATPTPTPAPPVQTASIDCSATYDDELDKWTVDCIAAFSGQFTTVSWSAPGANPASLTTGTKTFTTYVTGVGPSLNLSVTGEICNFSECVTPPAANVVVSVQPTKGTVSLEPEVYTCETTAYAGFSELDNDPVPGGTIQFFVDGETNGSPQSVDPQGTASISLNLPDGTYTIGAFYSGYVDLTGVWLSSTAASATLYCEFG